MEVDGSTEKLVTNKLHGAIFQQRSENHKSRICRGIHICPFSAFDIIEKYHLLPIQDFLLHPFKNNSGIFLTSCWCEVLLHQEQSPPTPNTTQTQSWHGFVFCVLWLHTPHPPAPHIKLRARLSHTQHNLTLYPRLTSRRLRRAKPHRVAMRIIMTSANACIIVITIIISVNDTLWLYFLDY
jgi:hypothetical protein